MTATELPNGYEVRFLPIKDTALLGRVWPFVEHALATAGRGAVAVSDNGLQVTAPVDLIHNLVATIQAFADKVVDAPTLTGAVLYDPPLLFPGILLDLRPAVRMLGLCPPDMRFDWFALGEFGGVLAFSGPPERQSNFDNNLRPKLKKLVPPPPLNRVYVPGVEFPAVESDTLTALLTSLRLYPADMRAVIMKLKDGARVLVSGPAERQEAYTREVLPGLRVLAGVLDTGE